MKIVFTNIIIQHTIIHETCKKIFLQLDLHKNYLMQKFFAPKFTRRKKQITVSEFVHTSKMVING